MAQSALLSIFIITIFKFTDAFNHYSISNSAFKQLVPFKRHTLLNKASFSHLQSTQTESDLSSSDTTDDSVFYSRIGYAEDEIALGIDPKEVLQWLGTREDIEAKILKDNRSFDEERAADEASKLMMDAEMVNSFIAYEKRKADPNFIKEIRDETLSDPKVIAQYAAWIGGGVGVAYFRNKVAAPKFASGEWQPLTIKLPFQDMPGDAAEGVSKAVDTVSQVMDTVSDTIPPDVTALGS